MTAVDDLLSEWSDAERAGDRDRLGALLTEDFLGIGPVGFVLPKPAWLARFGPDLLSYERLELDEITTREFGDTTVVVARQHAAGEANGNPVPADTRVSFVVVRSAVDGKQRIAGLQYSFMAPSGGEA